MYETNEWPVSPVEWASQAASLDNRSREVEPGIYENDPFSYNDGCTTILLRSGEDGPYRKLADRLCNLNGRL